MCSPKLSAAILLADSHMFSSHLVTEGPKFFTHADYRAFRLFILDTRERTLSGG